MGVLLPNYKTTMVNTLIQSITGDTENYYAFAAGPTPYPSNAPPTSNDDFSSTFFPTHHMLFGKLIANNDVMPVIKNVQWATNTVYAQYDNHVDMSNSNFYVIAPPQTVGGDYLIFKCLANANGAASTQIPDQVQVSSFKKSDGYTWRYITTVPSAIYNKFFNTDYCPIIANATVVSSAYDQAGAERVVITNPGVGYNAYTTGNGAVRSVVNSTLIQVENYESINDDFFTNSAIYIYNTQQATSQLRVISKYVANSQGNWAYLKTPANTTNITPAVTHYTIAPQVQFSTDGEGVPIAYATMNTSTNSISSVTMIDTGYGISRCQVSFISNSSYGSGAAGYVVTPPPGGHGSDPLTELYVKGVSVSFSFRDTENFTIPTNVQYNKIGLIVNPRILNANSSKGLMYAGNTFSAVLKGVTSPSTVYPVGTVVTGATSNAAGVVAYSDGTALYLTGDKRFANGEVISSANGLSTAMTIGTLGHIYTKNLAPIYYQNVDNVNRSNTQSETFKLIITV